MKKPINCDGVLATIEGVEHLARSRAYLIAAIDSLLALELLHEGNRQHWRTLIRLYLEDDGFRNALRPYQSAEIKSRFERLAPLTARARTDALAPLLNRLGSKAAEGEAAPTALAVSS